MVSLSSKLSSRSWLTISAGRSFSIEVYQVSTMKLSAHTLANDRPKDDGVPR